MQLYAHDREGNLIFANSAVKQYNYYCRECRGIIRLRSGLHRHPHFYHLQTDRLCASSGKSMTHLQIQYYLLNLLPADESQLEYHFPAINRIADVVWISNKIVFEVQCSAITADEVRQRNRDYASQGFQVVWILHDNRFNQKRVSAAEDVLKTQPYYFTNIDETGFGFVYDQFSLARRGLRDQPLSPLPIHPATLQAIPAEIGSAPMPHVVKMRYDCWPFYFSGDLLDCYFTGKNWEYFNQISFQEQSLTPPAKRKPWYYFFSYLYRIAFQMLLEKACR